MSDDGLPNAPGRYQLSTFGEHVGGYVVVLDTQTGRVWIAYGGDVRKGKKAANGAPIWEHAEK